MDSIDYRSPYEKSQAAEFWQHVQRDVVNKSALFIGFYNCSDSKKEAEVLFPEKYLIKRDKLYEILDHFKDERIPLQEYFSLND